MYALTRHETPENVGLCKERDLCGPNAGYIGAHYVFLFRLLTPAPSQLLDKINHSIIMRGIEQVIMTALEDYGNHRIKNPCRILHIVHNHCSQHRFYELYLTEGKRLDVYLGIGSKYRAASAPFSDL